MLFPLLCPVVFFGFFIHYQSPLVNHIIGCGEVRRCVILVIRPIIYRYLEQVWNGVNSVPVHTFIQPEPEDILQIKSLLQKITKLQYDNSEPCKKEY